LSERQAYFIELLSTNGGCELPCFWGIVPGKMIWETARQLLSHFVFWITDIPQQEIISHWVSLTIRTEDKNSINIELALLEKKGIVDSIGGVVSSDKFDTYIYPYSIKGILTTYSVPTRVWINLNPGEEEAPIIRYSLWLFYEHKGFVVKYQGAALKKDVFYQICPAQPHYNYLMGSSNFSEEFNMVWFDIQSPENQNPLEELVTSAGDEFPAIKPIEEATRMRSFEFYQLLMKDQEPACFDTQSAIWQ
jgi:hypothetical protein